MLSSHYYSVEVHGEDWHPAEATLTWERRSIPWPVLGLPVYLVSSREDSRKDLPEQQRHAGKRRKLRENSQEILCWFSSSLQKIDVGLYLFRGAYGSYTRLLQSMQTLMTASFITF